MDWSHIAENIIYPAAAIETEAVGCAFADFLDRLISYTGLKPSDIHLIGHSLGAHVVGAAGAHLKSGKVGRITGEQFIVTNLVICSWTTCEYRENINFLECQDIKKKKYLLTTT